MNWWSIWTPWPQNPHPQGKKHSKKQTNINLHKTQTLLDTIQFPTLGRKDKLMVFFCERFVKCHDQQTPFKSNNAKTHVGTTHVFTQTGFYFFRKFRMVVHRFFLVFHGHVFGICDQTFTSCLRHVSPSIITLKPNQHARNHGQI